jgi:hypothetical protein
VVRLVLPPCVTLLKVTVTGDVPDTGSTGMTTTERPGGVLPTVPDETLAILTA